MAYKWGVAQHINVLEMTAILAELRRRARTKAEFCQRYINVIDSMVCYHALSKGRTGSTRLNRVLRRIIAVEAATSLRPLVVWTLSKWNFSDGASRKYEVKTAP